MQFPTTLAAATLLSLATSTAAIAVQVPPATWLVSKLDAGCTNGQCSYLFDVSAPESAEIPKFKAQCTARTQTGDKTYRPCTLQTVGKRQSGPRRVQKVEAFLSLTPKSPQDTVLSIHVWGNDGNGVVTEWHGDVTTQPYEYYVKQDQISVVPQVGGSVAA